MISFRCEMCNGTVKINPDRQTCTCEYCGRTSMLTPEMKAYVDGLAEEERKEAERMRQREAMERMKREAMQRKEQKSAGCSFLLWMAYKNANPKSKEKKSALSPLCNWRSSCVCIFLFHESIQ